MAENPATWGDAEKVVAQALREADEARRQMRCGFSTPKLICEALREAGLLHEHEPTDQQ